MDSAVLATVYKEIFLTMGFLSLEQGYIDTAVYSTVQ